MAYHPPDEALLCKRVSQLSPDEAVPGARQVVCSMCGEPVYVSPASFEHLERGVPVVCMECGVWTGEVRITQAVLEEANAMLGTDYAMEDLRRMAAMERYRRLTDEPGI